MKATLHTDGGSRGNPGPAAIGFVLKIPGQETILHGETIGSTTNNQAEYQALRSGLTKALANKVREIECFLDSELVVKQMQGKYKVKDHDLRRRYAEVKGLEQKFSSVSYTHIRREKNKEADALVNEALDNLTPM